MREERRGPVWAVVALGAALGVFGVSCSQSEGGAHAGESEGGSGGVDGVGSASGAGGNAEAEPPSAVELALDATRPSYVSEAPLEYYRLDLQRDAAGEITLSRLALVESALVPHSAVAPEYVAVAYDADGVLSATPLIFPLEMKTLSATAEGVRTEEFTAVERSSLAVYVANAGDVIAIDIVDAAGESVFSLDADALSDAIIPEAVDGTSAPPRVMPGVIQQALTTHQLGLMFPHILCLDPGHEYFLDSGLLRGGEIIARTEEMNDKIAEALQMLTPAVLSSIATLAVARLGDGSSDVLGLSLGSALVINEGALAASEFNNTLIHEATHCYTFLVDGAAANGDLLDWPEDVAAAAQATVSRYRLSVGLVQAWSELHACSVEAGVASGYFGRDWQSYSDLDANAAGFADNYGGLMPGEDIAMYVETTILPTLMSQGICDRFDGLSQITPEVSVPFAKLSFLNAVGAISDEQFRNCVGSAVFGTGPQGIDFPGTIRFGSELIAGYADASGVPVFDMIGSDGGSYTVLLEVALSSEGASPLGMHRLDGIGYGNLFDPWVNGAYLGHDDPDRARVSEQGFVLISEASAEATQGFVFGLVLQNALGLNTDYLPFGTINIP